MRHSIMKNKIWWQRALAYLFWLAVWQAASVAIGQELFLVSPFAVIKTLLSLSKSAEFWGAVGFSLLRITTGFLLAILLGVGFAVLSARFQWVELLLYPLTAVINCTPVVSFIILALIWISSSNLSAFISFLMVFPIIYQNTLQGILHVDHKLLEMARVFRVGAWRRVLYIYLPDVMPFFVSACSVALGMCWKAGVAAEVIGLPSGSIGEKLYQAKIYLNTGEVFAWTVVIIVISILFEKLFLTGLRALQRNLEGGPA